MREAEQAGAINRGSSVATRPTHPRAGTEVTHDTDAWRKSHGTKKTEKMFGTSRESVIRHEKDSVNNAE